MFKVYRLLKYSLLLLISISIFSCQEDFNSLGSSIIGDPNFNFDLYDSATVIAYSRRAHPVQTNNLPVYQLGVYNDPSYGMTEASILSQLTMNQENPSFGVNPEIVSVILNLPYFSTPQGSGQELTFTLDSIFGNSPFKLSIYESTYFLRDLDPSQGFSQPQKYYSNQGPIFRNNLGDLLYQDLAFLPSELGIDPNPDEETNTILSPRIRVALPEKFFKEKILDFENTDALFNNSNFKNHFRGLHFIAEPINNNGTLIIFDMLRASIEIVYSYDGKSSSGNGSEVSETRLEDTFVLSFNAITVNTFQNNFAPEIEDNINNPNTLLGNQQLYLKGGAVALTVIDLFGKDLDQNGIPDELEDLRAKKWIINEANIIVNVDQNSILGGKTEPERLFLYDLNNNRLLIDYQLDNFTPAGDPLNFKTSHLGRLKRDASGKGESYKLKITSYLNNLINNDSTNVRLGLVVSQNINVVSSQSLLNQTPPGIENVPSASVISPEGTILHGSNSSTIDKRIKLNIYYTEIEN